MRDSSNQLEPERQRIARLTRDWERKHGAVRTEPVRVSKWQSTWNRTPPHERPQRQRSKREDNEIAAIMQRLIKIEKERKAK